MGQKKDKYPLVFETFREIGSYEVGNLTHSEPSSFNGIVRVHRYRVTVERIEESDEVIRERIQKLWDECNNSHHWNPLKAMAAKYGMELSHDTRTRNRKS